MTRDNPREKTCETVWKEDNREINRKITLLPYSTGAFMVPLGLQSTTFYSNFFCCRLFHIKTVVTRWNEPFFSTWKNCLIFSLPLLSKLWTNKLKQGHKVPNFWLQFIIFLLSSTLTLYSIRPEKKMVPSCIITCFWDF